MSFIDVPIVSDAASLAQTAKDTLTDAGWTPDDGDPEVVLIETLAPTAQNAAEVAAQVPASVFRKFGTDLYGVPYLAGAPAEAESTWTLVDDGAAHTIPSGTAVQIGGQFFQTVIDTDADADVTSVASVLLRAVDEGSAGDGFAGTAQLVNSLAWVNMVTLTSTSSGGSDAEDDTGYQDRLRSEIQATGPPVTDADFAIKAIATPNVGIGRATAVTTDARTVTVAVTDIDGNPLTTDDKTAVSAYLEAKREINFVVTVQDADYNYITITYSYAVAAGYVAGTVTDSINVTLRAFLNPGIWGALPSTDPASTANAWSNTTTIYLSVITALIQNTQGVDHVGSGTVKIQGTAADYSLTGTAPLPSVPDDLTFSGHTNTSTSITAIATQDTAKLKAHMAITGPGIPVNTTISSVSSTSIVISNAATATATVSLAATALVPTVL